MKSASKSLWYILVLSALLSGSVLKAQEKCAALLQLKIPNITIGSAELIPAGLAAVPTMLGVVAKMQMPAYCKVKGIAAPTKDSAIGFEIWMPASTWNGKFVQVGNGGLAGSIPYPLMYPQLRHGFAVAATDDGHTGQGTDGSWAAGHPEKVIDFGYRAVHQTAQVSRQIIRAYYAKPAAFSYFSGCSEGGREAMMEAQRFPGDFDGILAGSSALAWMQLMYAFAGNSQALLKDPASYIPESKRPAIEAAALKACGKQDGVTEKYIQDPLACHFDPATLLCHGADSSDCLTQPQVTALKKIYAGPRNSITGASLSPGYQPGPEAEPGPPGISYSSYIYGPKPGFSLDLIFSSAFFGNFVFDNPKYNSLQFDFGKDVTTANEKVGAILNATDPDLRKFAAHGKLLQYQGWYDGSPSPMQSVDYYRKVVRTMGGQKRTERFYRLFMVPGMMHCGLGPGPNAFGNMLDDSHAGDPERDIFAALQDWVEKGRDPSPLIATKYTNDNPTQPVQITRPLCPFPQQAKWNGHGNPNDAANFFCQAPSAPQMH